MAASGREREFYAPTAPGSSPPSGKAHYRATNLGIQPFCALIGAFRHHAIRPGAVYSSSGQIGRCTLV